MKKLLIGAVSLLFSAIPAFAGTTVIAPPAGWTLIQTAAGSGTAVAITSIPQTYNDLLVTSTLTCGSFSATANIELSPDNSTYYYKRIIQDGGGISTINGVAEIVRYKTTQSLMSTVFVNTAAGGTAIINPQATDNYQSAVNTGLSSITAVRINCNGVSISGGSMSVYGR